MKSGLGKADQHLKSRKPIYIKRERGLVPAQRALVDFGVWNIYPLVTGAELIQAGLPSVLWQLIQGTAWYAAQLFFAVCTAIAIFRSRPVTST